MCCTLFGSMDLPSAGQLARRLMGQHGLAGWAFRYNQRKRTLGLCNFTARRIELSAPFVVRNDESEIRDVILHEIAHALTPPPPEVSSARRYAPRRSGTSVPERPPTNFQPHGPAWRAMCLKIGANPDRLNTTAATPPGKWRAVCPGCQTTHHRHRKPAKGATYSCKACGPVSGALNFTRGI